MELKQTIITLLLIHRKYMSASEKLFHTIFHKHSFLGLAGILENLQTLLEGKDIVPSGDKEEEINEADLVIAAEEALHETVKILASHKKKIEVLLQLQKELILITSFAAQNSSKESNALWIKATKIINGGQETPEHVIAKESPNLMRDKKAKVLTFIKSHQKKNHIPDKIKNILDHDAKEIKNIKFSYDKYHDLDKDNLTERRELLTLPNKSVTKTLSKKGRANSIK